MSRYNKVEDEEVDSYISSQRKQGNNPKPEYSIYVNDSYFVAVDHLLIPCSYECAITAECFGGSMWMTYQGGMSITSLDSEYQELIKLLDCVDTNKDEREIGRDLVILLNQHGIPCDYQAHGIDIRFTNTLSSYKFRGCEIKKKFPHDVKSMYSEFSQMLKYLRQESLLPCLLLNVQTGEYFLITRLRLHTPVEESVDIARKIGFAIDEVCRYCHFHIRIPKDGLLSCGYPKCPAYKLRDFSSENIELEIKWIGSSLLLHPKDNDTPQNRFLDVTKGKWVLLDNENNIIEETKDSMTNEDRKSIIDKS